MSTSNKRIRGLSISRPLLVGSTATLLAAADKILAPPDHTHKWTVAIRSAASYPLPPVSQNAGLDKADEQSGISTRGRETEADYHKMVGGKDDISYFIRRVQFKLHETYSQPTRNVDKPPFQVTETGWGEFEIQVKVFFIPEANEKPLTFYHHLKLHPWLAHRVQTIPVAPPPPLTTDTAAERGETAMDVDQPDPSAVTPAAAVGTGASSQEPVEKKDRPESSDTDGVGSAEDSSKPTEAEPPSSEPGPEPAAQMPPAETDQPSEITSGTTNAASVDLSSAPAAVPSGLSAVPGAVNALRPVVDAPAVVHSWQYEEIVFPEPTEAFYEILVAHPPTPLPSSSAQAFTDPSAYNTYHAKKERAARDSSERPPLPPHPLHNPAGQLFDAISLEAVAGETLRLDHARIAMINEIEEGRNALIQKERELRKLKT